MTIIRIAATLLLAVPTIAHAKDDVDIAAYPELSAEVLLPPILAELKHTLADPYSVRDFVLCPAGGVKLTNGKPTRWTVRFSFNARNSFGGYTGVKTYSALFRDGHLSGALMATQFAVNTGIEGIINNMVVRRMATCPTIPDETVQKMMSPGASAFR